MNEEKKEVIDQVAELVHESSANPSNGELLTVLHKHFEEDARFQTDTTKIHESMNARMDTLATKEDVRSIFAQELRNFFKISGMNTKTFIVTTATIIGALVVIFGGLKAVLGWFGFGIIK